MAEKFKNKYRTTTTRLQTWDYGSNAAYFITMCTQNRVHYFGDVVNGKMQLSEIGMMAEKYWHEIPEHFPFVKLDAFVVMPNHIHGIIIIDKVNDDVDTQNLAYQPSSKAYQPSSKAYQPSSKAYQPSSKAYQPSSKAYQPSSKNKFGPQSKNLASIVRGYKIGVTKNAKKINPQWQWQALYYDHIIRDERAYNNIRNYIINNPKKWHEDKFH